MEKCSVGSETGKSDFSGVQGGVPSPAADAPAKASSSEVQSRIGSTVNGINIYTLVAGRACCKLRSASTATQMRGMHAWKRISAVNRNQLTAPDRIESGPMLKIPVRS
jgi:nucleoid-associated protein YgaU